MLKKKLPCRKEDYVSPATLKKLQANVDVAWMKKAKPHFTFVRNLLGQVVEVYASIPLKIRREKAPFGHHLVSVAKIHEWDMPTKKQGREMAKVRLQRLVEHFVNAEKELSEIPVNIYTDAKLERLREKAQQINTNAEMIADDMVAWKSEFGLEHLVIQNIRHELAKDYFLKRNKRQASIKKHFSKIAK